MKAVIIGGGGHAKVVIDTFREAYAESDIVGIVDDSPKLNLDPDILGIPILGTRKSVIPTLRDTVDHVFIAVGDNKSRASIVQDLEDWRFLYPKLIHPRATVSSSAIIEDGTLVAAGAVIQTQTYIGEHAIINTGATVDHENIIADFAHISPGAHLGGRVRVGVGAHLGIGSSVIQERYIGEWSRIGAGSAVIRDIPANVVAVGVPCNVIAG